jgi:hypothetical protein
MKACNYDRACGVLKAAAKTLLAGEGCQEQTDLSRVGP